MKRVVLALGLVVAALVPAGGFAAEDMGGVMGDCPMSPADMPMMGQRMGGMHGMGMARGCGPAATASVKGYCMANAKMHRDMMIAFSGDADVDFVRGMIPHHQGAIDMAKVVLEHGKDPEIKALAEGIIKAQEAEIAQMQKWLGEHAADVEKPAASDDEMSGDSSDER